MWALGPRKQLYSYQSARLYFFCKSVPSDLLLSNVRENSHKFLKSVKIQSRVLTLVCCTLAVPVKKPVHFRSGYAKEIRYTAGLSTRIWLALGPNLTFLHQANVRMDNTWNKTYPKAFLMDIRLFENVIETIPRNQGWVKENGIKELEAAKRKTWPNPKHVVHVPAARTTEETLGEACQEVRCCSWKGYLPD